MKGLSKTIFILAKIEAFNTHGQLCLTFDGFFQGKRVTSIIIENSITDDFFYNGMQVIVKGEVIRITNDVMYINLIKIGVVNEETI